MTYTIWLLLGLCALLLAYSIFVSLRLRRIQDEQQLFHNLLKFIPTHLFIKDKHERYTHISTSFANLIGKKPSEMIGKTAPQCFDLQANSGLRAMAEMDKIVIEQMQTLEIETQIPTQQGLRDFLVTKFPVLTKNERLELIACLSVDVTRLRQIERRSSEIETQYMALADQDLLGVYILQQMRFVYANDYLAHLLGYNAKEVLNLQLEDWLSSQDAAKIAAQSQERIEKNIRILSFEMLVRHRDGHYFPVMMQSCLSDLNGEPAFIGVVLDMTDQHISRQQQALATTVFNNSSEGIVLTDAEAKIITVNAAFSKITGYEAEDACGRVSRMFRIDHTGRAINTQMMQALSECGTWAGEFLDRRKNGELYPVWLAISCVRDENDEISHYVCIFSDITQRKYAEDRLQFLASHDTLTRLPNRASFIERLNQAVDLARDHQGKLAIMFIDLDRFKLINDSFGHSTGDDLLRMIAARLVYAVGEHGYLARLGGDEFTVMFENDCGADFLTETADRLLGELAQPLKLENYELFVTGSIGIATFPQDAKDSMALLKSADMAMYCAKQKGKNKFEFFTASMNDDVLERLRVENGLRAALERDEFKLLFQPQIDPFKQSLEGVEALLRWNSGEIGSVSPVRFIPVAEDSGVISAIGEWVMNEACQQLVRWEAAGLYVPKVSVNLSPRQFEDVRLMDKICAAIAQAGIEPHRFEVEITESTLMEDPHEAVRILTALKDIGVTVAIDDFGTGYSSLAHLKHLPLDCLKIDRAFVEGLPEDQDNAAITEAIIAMSRKLRLDIVVEGVETEAQLQFLMRCGCEVIQGYFYSPPIAADQLPEFAKDFQNSMPPKPWIEVTD